MAHIAPTTPYCWCPEYTIRVVPQRIQVVFLDEAHPMGTDYLAPDIDEAEDFCEALNRQLDVSPARALEIADAYIQSKDGAPLLLKPADFTMPDRTTILSAVQELLVPAYRTLSGAIAAPEEGEETVTAEMVSDTAHVFDRLVTELEDNIVYQGRHIEEMKQSPHLWEGLDTRLYRGGELLRHFRIVRDTYAEVREEFCRHYEVLTQRTIEFAPYFPPPHPTLSRVSAETTGRAPG